MNMINVRNNTNEQRRATWLSLSLFCVLCLSSSFSNATLIGSIQPVRVCLPVCDTGFELNNIFTKVNEIWSQADIQFDILAPIDIFGLAMPRNTTTQFISELRYSLQTTIDRNVFLVGFAESLNATGAATVATQGGPTAGRSVTDPLFGPEDKVGFAVAHALGHNLGLSHVPNDRTNLMAISNDFVSGLLSPEQIAVARDNRFLSAVAIPEPTTGFLVLIATLILVANSRWSKWYDLSNK